MKLNTLIGIACFGIFTSALAENVHTPTSINGNQKSVTKNANANSNSNSGHPYCGIYVVNSTGRDMIASGVVDQWSVVDPFDVPYYKAQFITLDFAGYCHDGMQNIKLYVSPYLPVNTGYVQAGLTVEGYIDYYNHLQYRVTT